MNKAFQYINEVENIISKIKTDCADSIEQTAVLFKEALVNNKKYFFSAQVTPICFAKSFFTGQGGLCRFNPCFLMI